MSHMALLEAIGADRAWVAFAMLAADPLLCTGSDDPSALMLALYHGQPSLAGAIAARRSHLTPYEAAATGDLVRLAEVLAIDGGAARSFAADGFTALHLSCYFGQARAVAMLLEAGADVEAAAGNATMLRPLHAAAAKGDVEICRALLLAGADPNQRRQGGYAPLHAAALRGDARLAALFVACGGRTDATAEDGRTPSDVADESGFAELAIGLRT